MTTIESPTVRLFASSRSWIEGEALRQLHATARLEGVRQAIGFPDLHPGKGVPVGAAFVTEGLIYPHLIGGDIGCGMRLSKTDLVRRDIKLDRWAKLRFELEHPWDGDVPAELEAAELASSDFDESLGTIGGGNHFAELLAVEEIVSTRDFKPLKLGRDQLVTLVHSGSRGLGEAGLRRYTELYGGAGVDPESFVGGCYLADHDQAVAWARLNRNLIARRFAATLGAETEQLWDGFHNSILRRETDDGPRWLHRKGAVESSDGFVVIPGSRGTLSYVVKPLDDGRDRGWSLAHGAGRKWARSESRARMRERFKPAELVQTRLGGRVICEERELLYEEAPAAYKNIEAVIQDLVQAGLVSVIATLRPLLTYKTRKQRR
jgi:release factor H-coupled RctB family protein